MDKIVVRIETEEQFNIFKQWNGTSFSPWEHYSRYDSHYHGSACFLLKQGSVEFCYDEYYKKEGWKIISFQEFEKGYLGKKVEGKVTNPINGNIYRALYEPSNYTYIFRYGNINTFIRVPVKDFGLNGTNGNLMLDKLVLFEPTKEEIDWFVACELAGKYVEPSIKQEVKPEEAWVPKVGDWVVIVDRTSSCNKVGDIGKITVFDGTYYKVTVENRGDVGNYQTAKDFRKAKLEEIPVTVNTTQPTKDRVPNGYGMKVGDKLPAGILNAWGELDKNCHYGNRGNWVTNNMFHGDRTIKDILVIDNEDVYLVSSTDKVYIKAKGFKEFLESKTSKDTTTNEELLKEVARRYPIGTMYTDVGPSKLGASRAIRTPRSIVEGSQIDVGVGYVYYCGKWAEVMSTPQVKQDSNPYKVGDRVLYKSMNGDGLGHGSAPFEVVLLGKSVGYANLSGKFEEDADFVVKHPTEVGYRRINKEGIVGFASNSTNFKVGDFVYARGLNEPGGMEIAKIDGDTFWLYYNEYYKLRGEYLNQKYQFSRWPDLSIVQKKGKTTLEEPKRAEEKSSSWSEQPAEYLNMWTSINPRFSWKEYRYNIQNGKYEPILDPEQCERPEGWIDPTVQPVKAINRELVEQSEVMYF